MVVFVSLLMKPTHRVVLARVTGEVLYALKQSVSKPLDTHCKCTPSVTNAVSFYVPEYRIV